MTNRPRVLIQRLPSLLLLCVPSFCFRAISLWLEGAVLLPGSLHLLLHWFQLMTDIRHLRQSRHDILLPSLALHNHPLALLIHCWTETTLRPSFFLPYRLQREHVLSSIQHKHVELPLYALILLLTDLKLPILIQMPECSCVLLYLRFIWRKQLGKRRRSLLPHHQHPLNCL